MTQLQREALFDILSLAIYADAHLSLAEEDLLQQSFVTKGWKAEYPQDLFIEESFERAREAAESDDGLMDYLMDRAEVFTTKAAQAEACTLVRDLLEADGITAEENEFYNLLIQALPRAR